MQKCCLSPHRLDLKHFPLIALLRCTTTTLQLPQPQPLWQRGPTAHPPAAGPECQPVQASRDPERQVKSPTCTSCPLSQSHYPFLPQNDMQFRTARPTVQARHWSPCLQSTRAVRWLTSSHALLLQCYGLAVKCGSANRSILVPCWSMFP